MLVEKVEVGFDLTEIDGPFARLDDPVKGVLNNTEWLLGGTLFYDITSDVRSIEISRGKSQYIEAISAGEAVVELNNRLRWYDPTYAASPFYGNIVPKREVRITCNDIPQYFGVIDDWNLSYTPDGDATATFTASDGFVFLNNQTLGSATSTVQLSGARVNAILDDPYVNWPPTFRRIDTGIATLGADVIADNTNVLGYLQLVERSEFGSFFISKDGYATFRDRDSVATPGIAIELSDDGTGIPYLSANISYGSETLSNEVVVSSVVTGTEVTAQDLQSQADYGIFNLTLSDLLLSSTPQLETLATALVTQFAQPTYRFESVDIRINDLPTTDQNAVLGLELGDVVQVRFTPSNIPPAIVRYAQVIRIDQEVDITGEHIVTLGLSTIEATFFTLSDPVFGRLSEGNNLK